MTTEDTDTTDLTHQPALPAFELPDYHGRKPASMRTSLMGAGTRVTKAHTIGDRVVLVIEARVKSAAHEETDDGLVYVEKVKVLDLFELDRDHGSRLISTIRSLYRTGEAAAKGSTPIPDLGDVGYTDGSGVVLTPDELAEMRGDPIRAMLSADLQPAVIVYTDGMRELWPDDFPKDCPRPRVGDVFLSDGDGEQRVERLLHHETGEELEAAAPELLVEISADGGEGGAETSNVVELRPSAGEIPDPDPFDGDLGDDVEGWESPDAATAQRIADAAEETLPTSADFAFVNRPIAKIKVALRDVGDLAALRRIRRAEEQGQGRGAPARSASLAAIDKRIAEVSS